MFCDLAFAYPEFLEGVDRLDGVLRQQVVEQGERAERVGHALEDARVQLLDDVALEVQRGQGVEVPEGATLHIPVRGRQCNSGPLF